ncbi:YncE family protein [Chloroflexota bacterium]
MLAYQIRQWFRVYGEGNTLGTYIAGDYPRGIYFDGTNIWVVNSGSDNVTKLLASDGSYVGIYDVGDYPLAICFDGTNIWVANSGSDNVTYILVT